MAKNKNIKLQCGYETECKCKSCLKCRRYVWLNKKRITLAEAIAIEDFATVDLDWWSRESSKKDEKGLFLINAYKLAQRDLSQYIMYKLMKRIIWGDNTLWNQMRKKIKMLKYI